MKPQTPTAKNFGFSEHRKSEISSESEMKKKFNVRYWADYSTNVDIEANSEEEAENIFYKEHDEYDYGIIDIKEVLI